MNAQSIWIVQPGSIELRDEPLKEPAPGEVLVRTVRSGISAGTELLFYKGLFPQEIPLDASISALSGPNKYPLRYGYAAVGEIIACGSGVSPAWLQRMVFAFQPHSTHFCTALEQVLPVPEEIPVEDAIFLPNMETAVNFLMDGAPLIGEAVVVLGQGIVGLLTTALLGMYPLANLVTLDNVALRRHFSRRAGAIASFDPQDKLGTARAALPEGADLVYEVTGAPEALNLAIELTRFTGRIVIGSWYGKKQTEVNLGGKFHRSRVQLLSSQVSTLPPELTGRWDKRRRFQVAWDMIRKVKPSRFITHRFQLEQAAEAYQLLDQKPETCLQVVFEYD